MAVQFVVEGDSFHKAYKKSGIGPNTIKKFYTLYVNKMQSLKKKKKINLQKGHEAINDAKITIFTPDQEITLMKCFKEFEYLFYGLTEKECRMLAYQMVINEDMKIPVGWKHGMASVAWLISFQLRHPTFTHNLEKPDRSCTRYRVRSRMIPDRTVVWEKKIVNTFYDDLEVFIQKNPNLKDNKRLYSLDEAYTSINPERQVVDRESKSDLLTTCCFICADGTSLPPAIIKPFLPFDVCTGIPPGALALTGSLGRLNTDLFTEVMQHFVKHSNSSLTNPSILIMDTDLCHLSSAALSVAKESGVYVLTLHAHVNCLLQPLHGQIFDMFHNTYYEEMQAWCKDNKHEGTACDIGQFVTKAYSKAMLSENIQNGFKNCGISPFDRDLFTDADYQAALLELDQTCIECTLRDDRSRKLISKTSPNVEPIIGFSNESHEGSDGDGGESSQGTKGGPQNEQSKSAKMAQARQGGMELDKLKRRLIRSVARLMKEKKTEEEVWQELKKECGKNCKTLWIRMRSLTLKKLKRLLDAQDCTNHVPAVARMTLTDWLLYDLVLVHEKIDVINRGNTSDSKVLNNLFALVQRFDIEGRSGDDLAEAWTAATISYNSQGHQCSPMLMQRRWYQVKELTRHKLYQFWFNYRGNERLLVSAKQDPPTHLQRAIALKYPLLITQDFLTWKERVQQKLVIMPEEFEVKMRKKDLMKPTEEPDVAVPDVLIVEQKVDTITVDSDSEIDDNEDSESAFLDGIDTVNDNTLQTPILLQVKTEPEDPDEHIDITEHPVYPEKPKDRFQDAIEKLQLEEHIIAMSHIDVDVNPHVDEDCVMPLITNVMGGVHETITTPDKSANNMVINLENSTEIVNTEQQSSSNTNIMRVGKELKNVINAFNDNIVEPIVIDDEDDGIKSPINKSQKKSNSTETKQIESNVIDITSPKAKRTKDANDIMVSTAQNVHTSSIENTKQPPDNNEVSPIVTAIASGSLAKAKIDLNNKETVGDKTFGDPSDSEEHTEDIIKVGPEKELNIESGNEVMIETNYADDGFEFADDGIEYNEEHNDQTGLTGLPEMTSNENIPKENAGTSKFDLKLLMNPVVYTTKLDKMKVYRGGRSLFDTIHKKQFLDEIILESKPVSAKSINVEQMKAEGQKNGQKNEIIPVKVEHTHEIDDLFHNKSPKESDNINLEILPCDDSKRVKLSSSLLRKPRSRSYNPIQLCKNPDFNTRLKRLTVGFLSSKRNRVFLKACKPMTIDLSKAFETMLINGTIYLKPSDSVVTKEVVDVSESAASIMPSAIPVQSLMDTVDVDKILQSELSKRMTERNKIINLPNISVVRQINQQLLKAEVAPIVTEITNSGEEVISVLNNTGATEKSIDIDTQPKVITNETPINSITESSHVKEITNPAPKQLVNQSGQVLNRDKSKKETVTDITNPLLPMMNDKSKEGRTLEKPKKLSMNRPMWTTAKWNNTDLKPYGESLLTIDTLYKVLNALDPASVNYKPKTKTNHNKLVYARPGRPAGSGTTNSTNKTTTDLDNQNEQPPINVPKMAQATIKPTPTKLKPNLPCIRKKQRNCCWARSRINKLNKNTRESKHKCPIANCRCCCKEILRQTEINHEIKLLEQIQNGDKFDETIEQVVKQSRDSSNMAIPSVAQVRYPPTKQQTHGLSNVVISAVSHVGSSSSFLANARTITQKKLKRIDVDADQSDNVDNHDTDDINNTEDTESQESIETTISAPESQVTIDLDDVDDVSQPELQSPTPKIRVYAGLPTHFSVNELRGAKGGRVNNLTPPPLVPVAPPSPTITPTLPLTRITRAKKVLNKFTLKPLPTLAPVESEVLLPCSCRPNVVVDKLSAMLVVDGSNECPQHTKVARVSKETRIYLNRKHMSASSRPFYVGKNKILLTNVTPRKVQLPLGPPAPLVPIELPEGVQLVLLPDGTITYLVDPGVELTPKQINSMPDLLDSIRQQTKSSGITLPTFNLPIEKNIDTSKAIESSDVRNNDNSMYCQNSENNNENEEVPSSTPESVQKHTDSSNSDNDQTYLLKEANLEPSNEVCHDPENQADLNNKVFQKLSVENSNTGGIKDVADMEEHSQSHTLIVDKENTAMDMAETEKKSFLKPAPSLDNSGVETEPNESESSDKNDMHPQKSEGENTDNTLQNKNTNNTAACSSRNLLSDLMEMSGIMEEDVTPVQQQPTTSTASSEFIQPLSIDTCQNPSMLLDSISPMSPSAQKYSISAQVNENVYNLNPITSFAELKYACDNNGLFFKLDLNNGVIVPINVCIQKTPELNSVKNATPSDVIDLTNEQGFSLEEPEVGANITVQQELPTNIQYKPNDPNVHEPAKVEVMAQNIKPKDLAKMMTPRPRGRPPKYYTKSILTKNQLEAEEDEPTTSIPSQEERKQALIKRLSNNLKPLTSKLEKRSSINILRKQRLLNANISILKRISNAKSRIEAKIDLIDSDGPMEEEYLLEDSNDDSDDEPLAKIAKKNRPNMDHYRTNAQESQEVTQGMDDVDFEVAIDAVKRPTILNSFLEESEEAEPVPTQLVLSGAALNQPLLTMMSNSSRFVANKSNDEDMEEDCILGV